MCLETASQNVRIKGQAYRQCPHIYPHTLSNICQISVDILCRQSGVKCQLYLILYVCNWIFNDLGKCNLHICSWIIKWTSKQYGFKANKVVRIYMEKQFFWNISYFQGGKKKSDLLEAFHINTTIFLQNCLKQQKCKWYSIWVPKKQTVRGWSMKYSCPQMVRSCSAPTWSESMLFSTSTSCGES